MSKRIKIKLDTELVKGWLYLVVHDDVEELRRLAAQYSGQDHEGTSACFQPVNEYWAIDSSGRSKMVNPDPNYYGILRIQEHHGSGVLAHESLHAAMAVYRRAHGDGNLGEDCGDAEEAVAWLVGDIVRSCTTALMDHGIWPNPEVTLF